MGVAFNILGCIFLYGKSKYFPKSLDGIGKIFKKNTVYARIIGYGLLTISMLFFTNASEIATGLILFAVTTSLVLSTMVIALPIHKNFIYAFAFFLITIPLIQILF